MDRPAAHKRSTRRRARVPVLAGSACYVLAGAVAVTGPGLPDGAPGVAPERASDPAVVLVQTLGTDGPAGLDQLGRFLEAHRGEEIRLHLRWRHGGARFTATEAGTLSAQAPCHPTCPAGVRGAITLGVDGVPAARHRFDGRGGEWWTTGGYVVDRVEVDARGGWSVRLRASGAGGPAKDLAGDCAALETEPLEHADPLTEAHVRRVQDVLNARGYGCVGEDGRAGPGTAEAVRRFQQDNALEVDGTVDAQTYRLLQVAADGD